MSKATCLGLVGVVLFCSLEASGSPNLAMGRDGATGRFVAFRVDSSGGLIVQKQNTSFSFGQASFLPAPAILVAEVAVATTGDGKLNVFVTDGVSVFQNRFHNGNLDPNGWFVIGGVPPSSGTRVGPLVAFPNADGRIVVFYNESCTSGQCNIFYNTQLTYGPAVTPYGTWTDFGPLDHGWSEPPGNRLVGVGLNQDGRMEVQVAANGTVWSDAQVSPGSLNYSGWWNMGTSFSADGQLRMASNNDGRLQSWTINSNSLHWKTSYQVAINNGWVGWQDFGSSLFDPTYPAEFIRDQAGYLWGFDAAGFPGVEYVFFAKQYQLNGAWNGWLKLDDYGGNSNFSSVGTVELAVGVNSDNTLEVIGLKRTGVFFQCKETGITLNTFSCN